eukprot:Skav209778  [mRNA]  locus=scaffold9:580994:582748:- [translate_table: standard]
MTKEALAVLDKDGESLPGIVHRMITDLYDPAKYVATEMFELPQEGTFVETLRFLLEGFSHETAEQPWLRLVDVQEREKQYGNTAFHICAYAGHVELLEVLVKHAVEYDVPVELLKSSRGESVLDVAQARNNKACFNLVAPFFHVQPLDPDAPDEHLAQNVLVVDGEGSGGQAPRVSSSLPIKVSLQDLGSRLEHLVKQLPCQPKLIYMKKIHLLLRGSSLEAARTFLRLTTTATSLTAYRCTTDSLDVCTHILQAFLEMIDSDPAWERWFFIPQVQGDPTQEEKERFTQTTLDLIDALKAQGRQGRLRLHSFGRDGSAKYSYPRTYLTKPFLVEVVQGIFHATIFVYIREKLDEKVEAQKTLAKFSKRSKQGRSVSQEDLKQAHFFTAKFSFIDRYCYCRDLVKPDLAETSPVDGLRAGVDVERVTAVVPEWLSLSDTICKLSQSFFTSYSSKSGTGSRL